MTTTRLDVWIFECVYERLKPKDDESTWLVYTGLLEELEYLKIETRLIDEKFASVLGECVIWIWWVTHLN
jgi:hypothetical protein